jgi:muramoyltetrapeptide carboxypeptidase
MEILFPPRLQPGDRVRFVSPASTPTFEWVKSGLKVELGRHILDKWGYLAGRDEDRLADMNDALRDPGVRAIIATRGGKGAYRIADGLDYGAARRNPKLFVGFSEGTIIHLALYKNAGLPGIHGAPWTAEREGKESADSFRSAATGTEPTVVKSKQSELTSVLTTSGRAAGTLLGGNQDMVAISSGWAQPSFDGAILLLESVGMWLGHIDRQLTMLQNSGALDGIRGVAIGQYTDCGSNDGSFHDWTVIDVLRDRLQRLNVPILGGLPIGHGRQPIAVPIGTRAVLDANAGTLTVEAAVR